MPEMAMVYVLVGLMAVLWLVFGVSAWSKVHSGAARRSFAGSLRPLGLLPDRLVAPVATAVTAGEILLTVGCTWAMLATVALPGERVVVVAVLAAAGLLLSVLTLGVGLALGRGANGRRSCPHPPRRSGRAVRPGPQCRTGLSNKELTWPSSLPPSRLSARSAS